jgi:hypothetical protein
VSFRVTPQTNDDVFVFFLWLERCTVAVDFLATEIANLPPLQGLPAYLAGRTGWDVDRCECH